MTESDKPEVPAQPELAELFDTAFAGWAKSATVRHIWQQAYGDEYPEEADPYSFVTLTDLRCIALELRVGYSQTFVDLACGRGGPGLWVAREAGAALVGIDFSQVAIEHATRKAVEFGLAGRARFQVGNFTKTGLPTGAFDAAMSVDALFLAPDKSTAIHEVARILRSGARFVFTTWDVDVAPAIYGPQLNNHRPVLNKAGFTVDAYEETPEWESHQRAIYEGVRTAKDALIGEMGEAAAMGWINEANLMLGLSDGTDYLAHCRRVLIVARKA